MEREEASVVCVHAIQLRANMLVRVSDHKAPFSDDCGFIKSAVASVSFSEFVPAGKLSPAPLRFTPTRHDARYPTDDYGTNLVGSDVPDLISALGIPGLSANKLSETVRLLKQMVNAKTEVELASITACLSLLLNQIRFVPFGSETRNETLPALASTSAVMVDCPKCRGAQLGCELCTLASHAITTIQMKQVPPLDTATLRNLRFMYYGAWSNLQSQKATRTLLKDRRSNDPAASVRVAAAVQASRERAESDARLVEQVKGIATTGSYLNEVTIRTTVMNQLKKTKEAERDETETIVAAVPSVASATVVDEVKVACPVLAPVSAVGSTKRKAIDDGDEAIVDSDDDDDDGDGDGGGDEEEGDAEKENSRTPRIKKRRRVPDDDDPVVISRAAELVVRQAVRTPKFVTNHTLTPPSDTILTLTKAIDANTPIETIRTSLTEIQRLNRQLSQQSMYGRMMTAEVVYRHYVAWSKRNGRQRDKLNWGAVLESEFGIGKSLAYVYVTMGKLAVLYPRLRDLSNQTHTWRMFMNRYVEIANQFDVFKNEDREQFDAIWAVDVSAELEEPAS